MQEIWKTIRDYEDYEVSNLGRVRNKKSMKLRKPREDKDGYFVIGLNKGGKQKYFLVHRLVACAFLENQGNFPQVNHIDENKKNNRADNLEWCTASYNINFGTRTQKTLKPVICVETGEVFASMIDVERQKGYYSTSICKACKGKLKTTGGFHWQYV